MYFEGNDDQNGRTIWSCFTSPSHPLKKARPTFKPVCVIQLNCRRVRTNASCETTSNIGELRPPKSIKNFSPFRRTMAGYLLCIYIYIIYYILYIYYIYVCVYIYTHTYKTLCALGKKLWHQREGSTNRRLGRTNVCLQSNLKIYFCTQI